MTPTEHKSRLLPDGQVPTTRPPQARLVLQAFPIQIVPDSGTGFGVRLMTDMSEQFAESRARYELKCDRVGVDFGVSTLIATDRGDLMGRGFLEAMRRLDRQLVGIARHPRWRQAA